MIVKCILVFLCLLEFSHQNEQKPCLQKDLGNEKIVCVCNKEYCDNLPAIEKVENGQFLSYVSSKSGDRFKKTVNKFETNSKQKKKIVKNEKKVFQSIHGFGGAFTDAAGINILTLPKAVQKSLLRSYFGDDGLEYSLCRVPIGGTDFSTQGYSYDDSASQDVNLTNFQLASQDFDYKIPFIKMAQKLSNNSVKFVSAAWTAPKWMKTNNDYAGVGSLKPEFYQTWADYFVKFLDNYKEHGITFWGISTGNEPSNALNPVNSLNTVGWSPTDLRKWIAENLGPAIRSSNHSEIKILAFDDSRMLLSWTMDTIFEDAKAKKYIDGVAVHWYWDNLAPVSILTDFHNAYPDKFILATEACNGVGIFHKHVDLGSWDRGESYADSIIEDINNWATGWLDWNLALDLQGGPTYINNFVDSPIIVNPGTGEFYKQPMFYVMGHFSKFVPPGSVRLGLSAIDDNVPSVAFLRPDNGTVIILLNKYATSRDISIQDEQRGFLNVNIAEKSITTLVYW